jgi:ribosomal protein S25
MENRREAGGQLKGGIEPDLSTTNKEDALHAYKSIDEITIPSQLQLDWLRFSLIRNDEGRKKPLRAGFLDKDNYQYNGKRLLRHLKRGHNYMVICGIGDLVVFDADEVARLTELNVLQQLPPTFTLKTGGDGRHYYYFCPGWPRTYRLFDPELMDKDDETESLHVADIQSTGTYVIGPNSIHKSGRKYEIIDDRKITTIEPSVLLKAIDCLNISKKKDKKNKQENETRNYDWGNDSRHNVSVTDIVTPEHARSRKGKNGREIVGVAPWHNSKAKDQGNHLQLNIDKNVWHCWHCFTKGTLVNTPDGLREIETLKIGETVVDKNGRPQQILNTFEREYNGEAYEIKSSTLSIKATRGHEILVDEMQNCKREYESYDMCSPDCARRYRKKRNGSCAGNGEPVRKWIKVEDIDPKKHVLLVPETKTCKKRCDIGTLIGWYIAEGHIVYRNPGGRSKPDKKYPSTEFTMNKFEYNNHNEVMEEIRKLGYKARRYDRKECNTSILYLGSTIVSRELEKHGRGAENKTFGCRLHEEETSDKILDALIKGDGCWRKDWEGRQQLTTISRKLAQETQLVLIRRGIKSNIYESDWHKNHRKNCQTKYEVAYNEKQKRCNSGWIEDGMWRMPIKDIKKINISEPVYNIETEDNTYQVPFIVHNCDSGGGWVELLAVREGIIPCRNAGPGCLSKDQYKQVMRKAEDLGLIEPWEPPARLCLPSTAVDGRRFITDIMAWEMTEDRALLKAPPREGKSHAAIVKMVRNGNGNYITHNHAIIDQQIRLVKELGARRVVWVEGRNQPGMCRLGRDVCGDCPLKPNEHDDMAIGHFDLENAAERLLREHDVLTKKEVPMDLCPYYALRYAERRANFCFTVVNIINEITPRRFTILDEDPTLGFFYPNSMEIASIKVVRGERHVKNNMVSLDVELKNILEHGKRPALKEYAKKCKEMMDVLESETPRTPEQIGMEIKKLLDGWKPKYRYIREEVMGEDSDITFEAMVNTLANLYIDNPVTVTQSRGGYKSIHILGDARHPIMNMEWIAKLPENAKILVIGATLAELFIKDIEGSIVEVKDFRYADRFTVVAIKSTEGKPNITELVKEIAGNEEAMARCPVLVLTGSKRSQSSAGNRIGVVHKSTNERGVGQKWNWFAGLPNLFYQNSVISRGIDIDWYNVLIAMDTNFAQPFWRVCDPLIADRIIADETTNSVLRISPTRRRDLHCAKVICIAEQDVWKVQYLGGRIIRSDASPAAIARSLIKSGATGVMEIDDGTITATSLGKDASNYSDNLNEVMKEEEHGFTSDSVDVATELVMKVLAENRNKWVNIEDLMQRTRLKESLTREALKKIHYQGRATLRKKGRNALWKLRNQ